MKCQALVFVKKKSVLYAVVVISTLMVKRIYQKLPNFYMYKIYLIPN